MRGTSSGQERRRSFQQPTSEPLTVTVVVCRQSTRPDPQSTLRGLARCAEAGRGRIASAHAENSQEGRNGEAEIEARENQKGDQQKVISGAASRVLSRLVTGLMFRRAGHVSLPSSHSPAASWTRRLVLQQDCLRSGSSSSVSLSRPANRKTILSIDTLGISWGRTPRRSDPRASAFMRLNRGRGHERDLTDRQSRGSPAFAPT